MEGKNSLNGLRISDLKTGVSLQLYNSACSVIFESSGKWLYPLFEVEVFLKDYSLDSREIYLHDKIAGRAAACLISRMGFRWCFIDTVSEPALEIFESYGVVCRYKQLVEKIACQTEELLNTEHTLEEVYYMLSKRAGRLGISSTV